MSTIQHIKGLVKRWRIAKNDSQHSLVITYCQFYTYIHLKQWCSGIQATYKSLERTWKSSRVSHLRAASFNSSICFVFNVYCFFRWLKKEKKSYTVNRIDDINRTNIPIKRWVSTWSYAKTINNISFVRLISQS